MIIAIVTFEIDKELNDKALKEKFLEVLRTTKQNVFVLAAKNDDQRHAMTVSSVFSVSLEPMSMAVSVNQSASLHALLKEGSKFSLNLLKLFLLILSHL